LRSYINQLYALSFTLSNVLKNEEEITSNYLNKFDNIVVNSHKL